MTAIVSKIDNVRPHGDNLTIVTVGQHEVVANRKEDGSYRWEDGEICVYISEGSIIPDNVLQERGYWDYEKGRGLLEGKKGNRVKMRRFAGHESRGLLFKLDDVFVQKVDTPSNGDLIALMNAWMRYKKAMMEELSRGDEYDGDRVQSEGLAFECLYEKHADYLRIMSGVSDFNYSSKEVVMPMLIDNFDELSNKPFIEVRPDVGTDVTELLGITEHQSQ